MCQIYLALNVTSSLDTTTINQPYAVAYESDILRHWEQQYMIYHRYSKPSDSWQTLLTFWMPHGRYWHERMQSFQIGLWALPSLTEHMAFPTPSEYSEFATRDQHITLVSPSFRDHALIPKSNWVENVGDSKGTSPASMLSNSRRVKVDFLPVEGTVCRCTSRVFRNSYATPLDMWLCLWDFHQEEITFPSYKLRLGGPRVRLLMSSHSFNQSTVRETSFP